MINFPLTWHPGYAHHDLASMGVLLLSEEDEFVIASEDYQALDVVISAQGSLADYVFKQNDTVAQVARLKRVDQLVADGLLLKAPTAEQYRLPSFAAEPKFWRCAAHEVYCLSDSLIGARETVTQCIRDLNQPMRLVLTDDYLDPRLLALNARFRAEQQDWLLIKLTGSALRVGPFFRTSDTGAACYQCLHARLVQNKPVREWLRRYQQTQTHQPVPVRHDVERALDALRQLLTQRLPALLEDSDMLLYQWRESLSAATRHPVAKRPQCACCGDPDAFAKLNDGPLTLREVDRVADGDGGYRTLDRASTLAAVASLIDPLTGIISDVSELADGDSASLAIYRAAYFQNSFAHDRLSVDTFVQLSLGKGVAREQARISALGEALERQAAQYQGDEAVVFCPPSALAHRALLPQQLSPFSARQYQQFSQLDGVSLQQPQWVKPYDPQTAMHWTAGWSLTRSAAVYFPAAYCFANTPFADQVYSLYNHNGNAAGSSIEEAILQGALEVIERDATAIWWYNQVPRPQIEHSVIAPAQRQVIDSTLAADWDYWLLDISHDLALVSVVAVGQHRASGKFVLGFGTHLDVAIACARALTEMYQLILVKDRVSGPFDFDALEALPFLFPRRNSKPLQRADFPQIPCRTINAGILYLLEVLQQANLELCVVRYTRPDSALYTVKVIVPGLCHFWPQFANPRLFSVPVALGWLSKALSEEQLNPVELYL